MYDFSSEIHLWAGAHSNLICDQLSNIFADEGANSDVRLAAQAPAPLCACVEHLQRKGDAVCHQPVVLARFGFAAWPTLQPKLQASAMNSILQRCFAREI